MFVLKQYDIPLIYFDIIRDPIDGQSCQIKKLNNEYKHLFPIGMKVTDEGVFSWLQSRIIPKNREFVESFLAKMGLSRKDIYGIIKVSFGLSLNDAYWVVEDDFEGMYSDYNLYDNDFEKALSLIAYTGYGSSRITGFTSSPEFTTTGMLRKGWRRLNKKILLYKGGTSGAANAGNEPYSEYLASQIAKQMGINHVEYNLAKWKGNICSTCELFCDKQHSFVPIYKFVESKDIKSIAKFLRDLGEKYYDEFVNMIIFDALIYNEDRHLGNYGLIVDNKTNEPCAFAPLFDHGLSLFNYAMMDDLENLMEYRNTRLTSNGVSFDSIAAEFITSKQKNMLKKMIGFKFEKHPSYNLPAKRVKIIQEFLRVRVTELLNL